MDEKQRLFFALWPDEPLRQAIAQAVEAVASREKLKGHRVSPARYHITLLYLGDLDPGYAPLAQEAAQTVPAEPFLLSLSRVGHFHGAKVLWVGPQTAPPALIELWLKLRAAMKTARIPHERSHLTPHITCLRKVDPTIKPVEIEPIQWPVKEFVLIHSILTGRPEYRVLARWSLNPDAGPSVKTGHSERLRE